MASNTATVGPGRQDWLILIFLSIIWGSSFILIKYALHYFAPVQVGALRVLISSVAFIPIFLYNWKKIDWSLWPFYLLVGLTGSGIPSFLFPLAQQELSSSVAGILNSLTPLFTLIIGAIFFASVVSKYKILGVFIGLIGAIVLTVMGGEAMALDRKIFYGLYIVAATICYGTSVNVVKERLNHINPTLLSSITFCFLVPFALVMFFATDTYGAIMTHPESWKGIGYVAVLSLLGTFLASILFYQMVQRTNAIFGSSVTYLIPIISLMWGVADGELFTIIQVMGMALILIGVYLSRK